MWILLMTFLFEYDKPGIAPDVDSVIAPGEMNRSYQSRAKCQESLAEQFLRTNKYSEYEMIREYTVGLRLEKSEATLGVTTRTIIRCVRITD